MSDESKKVQDEATATEQPDMSRRKLMYVAPAFMSQRLFNAVSGCGKVNPNDQSCAIVAFQS